jgi:putative redox protein
MLTALAGCTAMDVISILRKMKVEPDSFSVETEADLTDDHPKIFKAIRIVYRLRGKGIDKDKVKKAVELSQEKYCGVSAMLKMVAPIDYEIVIEE